VDLASAIFAFTDRIPGAEVGEAIQDVDMSAGSLVSRVKLTVFPGFSGWVVTTSSIAGAALCGILCAVIVTVPVWQPMMYSGVECFHIMMPCVSCVRVLVAHQPLF
jgi:hypothetical protein